MTTLQKVVSSALIVLCGVIAVGTFNKTTVVLPPQQTPVSVGSTISGNTFVYPTQSSTTVSQYATTAVVATSTGRTYLIIQNTGATNAWLGFGQAAVPGSGYFLAASSSLTFDTSSGSMYYGSIQARSSPATTTLLIIEK